MRNIILMVFCLVPLVLQSMEKDQLVELSVQSEDCSEKLLNVTQRYLDLIHRISQGEDAAHREISTSILTPDCKKIFNGTLYTATRDDFISDLLEVNRTQGCWSVDPVDIISSPQQKTVVLRLMINMEKVGVFTTIVILRFDSNYLIYEINEVFNKVEGSYNFDGSGS